MSKLVPRKIYGLLNEFNTPQSVAWWFPTKVVYYIQLGTSIKSQIQFMEI